MFTVQAQSRNLGLGDFQQETAYRLMVPAGISLTGRSAVFTVLPGLPANKWQLEVQGCFEDALSVHQLEVMAFVSRDSKGLSPYGQIIHPDVTSASVAICGTQIMRNTGAYRA